VGGVDGFESGVGFCLKGGGVVENGYIRVCWSMVFVVYMVCGSVY